MPSTAVVGSIQELVCTVDTASTAVSFRWFFNGGEITTNTPQITISDSGNKSTLQIVPVKLRHGGEYECRASFDNRQESDRGTLRVKSE